MKLFLSGVQGAAIVNDDNIVNLAQFWNTAEFNVFGDCCLHQANFNSGSTIVPRTKIVYGGTAPPNCVATGFTGETNNLSFGPNAPPASQPGPAVLFTESSAGGAPSACASATSVGDTHLMTFDGVKYDFQAQGDFVLMQADSDFAVHTRQATAVTDPRWIKNATINKAVATQMGDTRVAICLNPARLLINSKLNDLGDGKSLSLPGGVDVSRKGNVYLVMRRSGDSVSATLNDNGTNSWIDVSVGLGHAAPKVSGLLGTTNANVNEVATREGVVLKGPISITTRNGTALKEPIAFEDLYTATPTAGASRRRSHCSARTRKLNQAFGKSCFTRKIWIRRRSSVRKQPVRRPASRRKRP